MNTWIIASSIGLVAGILSGLMGIGGGIIMIPALMFCLNFDQHLSQGTTLAAMVPPIGFFAAYHYYNNGYVNVPVALGISLGFFIGGLVGAKFVMYIPGHILKKAFAILMLGISIKILLEK